MTDFAPDVPLGHNYDIDEILSCVTGAGGVTKGQAVKISATSSNSLPTEPTILPTAAVGDKGLGVALKTGAQNDIIPVLWIGVTKVTANGAVAAGASIVGDVTGKVSAGVNTVTIPAGATTVTSSSAQPTMTVNSGTGMGRSLQAPAAGGDLFVALICGAW